MERGAPDQPSAAVFRSAITAAVSAYTAVDHREDAALHVHAFDERVGTFQSLVCGFDEIGSALPCDHYDVLLIDVEPHGREVEVYEQVRRHMSNPHMCILKHVGCIDMYGDAMATAFVDEYAASITHHYVERDYNRFRDAFVVMAPRAGD